MMLLVWLVLIILLVLSVIALLNVFSFPRLTQTRPASDEAASISVLIPARNEALVISRTIRRLLAQDDPALLEVLLLDDGSSDATVALAEIAAGGDPRFRLICGIPLPDDWSGKNWACWQLAQQARGDVLVFTDADVLWQSAGLRHLRQTMQSTRADCLTVWPTQISVTWGERLVVPLIMLVVLAYLPELAVRYLPLTLFAAANGQCIAFKRSAYTCIGGHVAVKQQVVEDVALARAVKRHGLRLVMALGDDLISTRMYQNWSQVRAGFAKNILAGHGGLPLALLASALFHWALFLLPWLWLALGAWLPFPGWPLFPAALVALGLSLRLLTAAVAQQRLRDALLLPLSVLLLTVIAVQSLWWHYRYGGPIWKGRVIVPVRDA